MCSKMCWGKIKGEGKQEGKGALDKGLGWIPHVWYEMNQGGFEMKRLWKCVGHSVLVVCSVMASFSTAYPLPGALASASAISRPPGTVDASPGILAVVRAAIQEQYISFVTQVGQHRPASPQRSEHNRPPAPFLLSNGQFVFGPNVGDFDLANYLLQSNHPLSEYATTIAWWSAYTSVNPRVILTLLELQETLQHSNTAGNPVLSASDPEGSFEEKLENLLLPLATAFYEHLYAYGERNSDPPTLEAQVSFTLADGNIVSFPAGISSGTCAIVAVLAPLFNRHSLDELLSPSSEGGFAQTYRRLFPQDDPLDQSNQIQAPTAPPADLFQFPFPVGSSWWFNGVHNWNGGGAGRPYSSIDFGTAADNCNAPPSGDWTVAAAGGNGYHPGGYSCWYRIDHGSGWSTSYYHLLNVRGDGGVNINEGVGTIACETCAGGFATTPHVHFSLLYNGAYTELDGTQLSGWTIHEGDGTYNSGYIERDGQIKYPYQYVYNDGIPSPDCPQSGGVILYRHANYDCGGGGNGSGYVIRGGTGWQNVPSSFNDQASSLRVPSGWSVRLYEHSDRNGASACRNADDNDFAGDQYDGGGGLNDSISSFEVFDNGNCGSGSSNPVILYEHPDYNGSSCALTGEGWANFCQGFNDLASSVRVEAGWSTRLYQHSDRGGSSVCFTGNDSNFSDNTFQDGSPLDNQVSSFEAYEQSDCPPLASPPDSPSLVSPSDGATLAQDTDVVLDWNESNAAIDYYAHLWGGPGIDINSGWVAQTSWHIGAQWPGTYQWQVKARNDQGESGWSATWTFTINEEDTVAPTGRITSPTAGAIVTSCPLNIRAEASDEGSGVDRVEFHVYYDDLWHHLGDDTIEPYLWDWDCSTVTDQYVWLTLLIRDRAGNITEDPGGRVLILLNRSKWRVFFPCVLKDSTTR